MSSKKETFARFGIFTKGVVYVLIGGLTAYTAFSSGSGAKGSNSVLDYVVSQPFGQILLGLMVLGILAFTGWRFYLAIKNPEGGGEDDKKSAIKRAAYLLSALSYLTLAIYGIQLLLNSGSSGGSSNSWLSQLLSSDWGTYLVYFIALCLLGKAIYELYRAYSGKFTDKIRNAELDSDAQSFLIKAGKLGFTARGIVIGVIAYLFFKAAMNSNAGKAGGTKDAFQFISEQGGVVLMGVIAVGLSLYGIYLLASSRYRNIPVQ
ncbi:MAG: DUF1206 domain-containing protein [Nonlabens sp.]